MHEALQHVVGTAIVDARFRQQLLDRSTSALNSFGLTGEEWDAIHGVQARTMQGFARELQRWILQNATPQGAGASR